MEALSINEILSAVGGKLICGSGEHSITSVSTNSKTIEEGGLFVPIIGERVDAHDYIDSAFEKGAAAAFVSKDVSPLKGRIYIWVSDTKRALLQLSAYYRRKFELPVIGITGSVGKTTTKEMIAAALGTQLNIHKTAGNMNSQTGVPLTIFGMDSSHDAAVIEMGISETGEMERLCYAVRPDMAVVSNIGVSHIANLGSRENIRKEKLSIVNRFHEGSVLFINGNDPLLKELLIWKKRGGTGEKRLDLYDATVKGLSCSRIEAFGTGDGCSIFGTDIRTEDGKTLFTFHYWNAEKQSYEIEEIILSVLGDHNVHNALVALAIAYEFGIHPAVAKQGLQEYRPIAMRGQIHKVFGMQIIDDTYNASPDSMKSGIGVLLALRDAKRRIAVLADSLDLGDYSYESHYEVGSYLADKPVDLLVTIGEQAKIIAKAVTEKTASIPAVTFDNNEDAIDYLFRQCREGDALLVKGSRGMHLEQIVQAFINNDAKLQ